MNIQNWQELVNKETTSIRKFIEDNVKYIHGKTLDFGCGKQPYKDIILSSGAEYFPFDRKFHACSYKNVNDIGEDEPLLKSWDTIVCTGVLQFIENPKEILQKFHNSIKSDGYIIISYPTNWPEVNREDRQRFTESGMNLMLKDIGFEILVSTNRGNFIEWPEIKWYLSWGYGCVIKKT